MTLSYHNDKKVKERHVEMAKAHLAAGMLIRGTYGDYSSGNFQACSVGCFAHDLDSSRDDYHAVVAEDAGWPVWLVHLSDTLFEGLPEIERAHFHVQLREAVPVGVNLEPVRHKLAIRRLNRVKGVVLALPVIDYMPAVVAALDTVLHLHEAEAGGNVCELSEWSAAESAAWSAAESAAWSAESAAWSAESAAWSAESAAASAARSAARSAAWSAAWSAASAAASAARSAARSAAWSAASAAYQQERDDLLEILREAA